MVAKRRRPTDSNGSSPQGLMVPPIPHATLFFQIRAREKVALPGYLGSTLRGGLARAMRRVVCVARQVRDCQQCPFVQACVYAAVFETPRPRWAERYPTLASVPHPMVIEPPPESGPCDRGEILEFAVRLFGRATDQWAHVVVAAYRMAEAGLGRARARFEIIRVLDGGPGGKSLWKNGDLVPHASVTIAHGVPLADGWPRRVEIKFLTPTRLVEGGRLLRRPTLQALVRSLAFRAATISYFHCGLDWDPTPVEEAAQGDAQEVEAQFTWKSLQRFSSRQGQKVPLDGFLGRVVYEGDVIQQLFPLLRLGEILHAGKGTVFGLGKMMVAENNA